MARNNLRNPNQSDLLAVHSLVSPEHPGVEQASKKTIRGADFWVDFDLGCLLAAARIKTSPVGRKPRSRLRVVVRLVEAGWLARSLAVLDGSLRLDSLAVVAF